MNGLFPSRDSTHSVTVENAPNSMATNSASSAYNKFEAPPSEKYTTLRTYPEMASGHAIWMSDYTGIIPKDTDPPRYEFKHLSEHGVTFEHSELKKVTDKAGDATLKFSHRFWGEFFGGLQLICDFLVAFVLELVGFAAKVTSHLVLGVLIRLSDFLIKPLMVYGYNMFVISGLNLLTTLVSAIVQTFNPILDVFQRCAEIVAIVLRSIRLFDYYKNKVKNLKQHEKTIPV